MWARERKRGDQLFESEEKERKEAGLGVWAAVALVQEIENKRKRSRAMDVLGHGSEQALAQEEFGLSFNVLFPFPSSFA